MIISAIEEKNKYTYEDYLRIPDDKRYEIIDGKLIMTPSPLTRHQRISRRIAFALELFVIENDLGEIFYAPYDVVLDNENVIQPDIMFISKENSGIITDKNIQGAPDLVIEILSEASAYRDMVKKKRLYAKFGVKEYWIVDPIEMLADIFVLKDEKFDLYKNFIINDILQSPLLNKFKIDLKEIFK